VAGSVRGFCGAAYLVWTTGAIEAKAPGMSKSLKEGAPDWLRSHGTGWTAGEPVRLLDNPYFAVDVHDAVAPTGHAATYWVHRQKNLAVGVIPLFPNGDIMLVGQWRFPFGTYSWELPEGGVPPGEPAQDGAARELREEVGLIARDWRRILVMQLSNSSSDELCEVFLATGLVSADIDPDPTEALAPARVPFHEALTAAVEGHIQDSITVAALLRLHHMAVTGELGPDLAATLLRAQPDVHTGGQR
jgi:8-oxo-dGDP phosphatase